MRAFLLAAGQGTRLRPLTESMPKCMVPLADKPLIAHLLTSLRAGGVQDFVIVTGYCAGALETYLNDQPDVTFRHNPDYMDSNMVYSLLCAEDLFNDDCLISYTDILYASSLVLDLIATPDDVAMAYDPNWLTLWQSRMSDPLADAETFELRPNGTVIALGGKPQSLAEIKGQYMGLIRCANGSISDLAAIYRSLGQDHQGKSVRSMYMTDLLQMSINSGMMIRAVPTSAPWLEVDTLDDLAYYEHELSTPSWRQLVGGDKN